MAALLALSALGLSAHPGSAGVELGLAPRAVPGELLVRFHAGATLAERAAARERAGVRLERELLLPGLELVRAGAEASVSEAITALEREPGVRYAEPNWIATPQAIPNDTRFGEQWALQNTGQGGGTPGADISAPEAWDITTGSRDVVVAVIDTGVAYDQPDLADNMWQNPGEAGDKAHNRTDDDGNGLVDDRLGWDFENSDPDPYGDGHGTLVSGPIAAEGGNGRGISGVSQGVSLMPLRVCVGNNCEMSDIVEAIAYAGRMGADVANVSIGHGFSQAAKDAIDAAPGTLFVAPSGNNGEDTDPLPLYPCGYTSANVICAAATDRNDALWNGSNFGATSVDLGAPGVQVLTTTGAKPVFSDNFEGTTANWDYDDAGDPVEPARWRRIAGGATAASLFMLTDSQGGNYPNGANTTVTLQNPVDLSGEAGCALRYGLNLETEVGHDYLRAEAASSPGGPWVELERHSGNTAGWSTQRTANLDQFEGGDAYLRFRLTSDAATTLDGADVDDITVLCEDPASSYTSATGTSLAAPYVAGAAALIKAAYPDASVAELRARILGSVDPLPSLEGKTVTGGRLNVYAALTETPDTTAPNVAIDDAPPSTTSSRSATFAFSSSDAGARFECRLDGGEFAPCVSPKQYDGLADGGHGFAVRAIDGVGNVSAPATRSWTVEQSQSGSGGGQEDPASDSDTTSGTTTGSTPRPAPISCPLFAGWPFDPCARLSVADSAARRRGALLVRARCVGPSTCRGDLRALVRPRAGVSRRRVLARGSYEVSPGERHRVRLRLTRAGRRVLSRRSTRRRVRLMLQVRPSAQYTWRTVDRVVVR